MRRLAFLFLLLFAAIAPASPAAYAAQQPEQLTAYTTLPWLTSMASFIVGTTVDIKPLSEWRENGTLKNIGRLPDKAIVIALDPIDVKAYKLSPTRPNLYLLYEQLPVQGADRASLPYDPSILPFLSQRMLIIVSRLKPENYSFYQRRLAEFQSRMESTLEVGRSQIENIHLLDLTGASGVWIRAASGGAVRPPDDLIENWSRGERIQELHLALNEAAKRSWWIAIDAWTPPQIRSQIMGTYKNVYIAPPHGSEHFFVYLQDIYLEIWNKMVRN